MFKILKNAKGIPRKLSMFSIFFVLIASVFDLSQVIILNSVVGLFTKPEYVNSIQQIIYDSLFWILIGSMFLAAIGSLVFGVLSSYFGSKSSLIFAQQVRKNVFAKVQSLSFGDVDHLTASSLVTRLTNDVQKAQISYQMVITMFIKVPILMIGGLIFTFITNWIFGLIAIAMVIALVVFTSMLASNVIPKFTAAQKNIDGSTKIIRENVLGMRVVKAFNLQEDQKKRFNNENKNLRKNTISAWSTMVALMPTISFIFQVVIVISLFFSGYLSSTDPAMAQNVFGVIQMYFMILAATIIAIMVIINVSRAYPSIKRINEIEVMENSIPNAKKPKKMNEKLSIEFKKVNFKYEAKAKENILTNISFKINEGETWGIIGGTGSGKSSMVNLIPRLYDVTSGEVLVCGTNVKDIDKDELSDKIGVVIQENFLFSGTIESNLKYGNQKATEKDMDIACEEACASEFINSLPLKYKSKVEQRGKNFSGGQKQRLSIARTLMKKPNILILDDTTSALDLLTEAKLQANIKNNYKKSIVLVVAQRVSAVKDADNIIVMENGKINAIGSHEQLLKSNKIYQTIVETQLGKAGE